MNRVNYKEWGNTLSRKLSRETDTRRKYDGSRRQADADARHRRIVEQATALFLEYGFGATSISQIAAAAEVSPQTIYATFGSKAGVLARVIDVAVVGDFNATPVVDRAPAPEEVEGQRFTAFAHFIRTINERVAPLIRVMEQAASSDPALSELRVQLVARIRADSTAWASQLGRDALRPGLSTAEAGDVMAATESPYVYSMLTVDAGWSPDRYEHWLAHALPNLLLAPHLLR